MDPNSKRVQVTKNEIAKNIPANIVEGLGIVITAKNYVVGNLGTGHWFQLREKYCFTGTVNMLVDCNSCGGRKVQKLRTFYKIDINGEEFLIDKRYIVEYNQLIDNTVANKTIYESALAPDIFYPEGNDYAKQTEQITGAKFSPGANYRPDPTIQDQFQTIDKSAGTNSKDEAV